MTSLLFAACLYVDSCMTSCSLAYQQNTLACDQIYEYREDKYREGKLAWRLCLNDIEYMYFHCRMACMAEEEEDHND